MCVQIGHGSSRIETVGELVGVVGKRAVVLRPGYGVKVGKYSPSCLCPVDVEATAANAGMQVRRGRNGWPDWELTPDARRT